MDTSDGLFGPSEMTSISAAKATTGEDKKIKNAIRRSWMGSPPQTLVIQWVLSNKQSVDLFHLKSKFDTDVIVFK